MATQLTITTLYDQDFHLWVKDTITKLREGQFEDVDLEHLIEEIEGLTKSDQRAIKHRLECLLEHLLKLAYWEAEREYNQRGWKDTIREQRRKIQDLLHDSPSLNPFFRTIFEQCYQIAREEATAKSGLPLETFPSKCPFEQDRILALDYLPA